MSADKKIDLKLERVKGEYQELLYNNEYLLMATSELINVLEDEDLISRFKKCYPKYEED